MIKRSENRIYIVGAGFTGTTIAEEIRKKKIFGRVVAFLDDDYEKIGKKINNVPILGPLEAVIEILKTTPADEAIIAVPGSTKEELKRIYSTLKRAEFSKIKIVPRVSQILEDEAHLIQAREINPEDLLARSPVKVNLKASLSYLRGKRVLVTGAGGSIGSELSRQLLSGGAERLYLFGHGENSIYEIERELKLLQEEGIGEKATIVPIIGEIQDREYVMFLLKRLNANVVFHTAAHKHVPLLEANPVEAVKNNVFGTKNIVDASRKTEVERFVFISTDKAVEPGNVYGATKLIAEEIVLKEGKSGNKFLVVRFGNVLGSRGSILPLFQKQIFKGGPITITHPDTKRFFMTIPEASSLVLKAGGVGEGGTLYLLDMGEPVLIKELAEQMIRFYGYEPEKEIKLIFTGLRPGEKLNEKLWTEGEIPKATESDKILKLHRNKLLINGNLKPLIEKLAPICFFSRDNHKMFRNRRYLKEVLKEAIPGIRIDDNEPEY
ncbi:MAG: polysaccharide biosynthesis protein [Spirochaetes bacterium]|nr:polysaccharide biosynthesis protein [Spirochaetota bacterium]